MFDIMKSSPWDDMWRQMDAFMKYPFAEKTIEKTGLKSIINRPHNLINIKDAGGNVVGQRLEVVTTPFAKDDVKVTVDGNILTISCGRTMVEGDTPDNDEKEGPEYVYHGISNQNYEFSVKMSDNIDKSGIKAKNIDGVLSITLPFNQTEKLKEAPVQIAVE